MTPSPSMSSSFVVGEHETIMNKMSHVTNDSPSAQAKAGSPSLPPMQHNQQLGGNPKSILSGSASDLQSRMLAARTASTSTGANNRLSPRMMDPNVLNRMVTASAGSGAAASSSSSMMPGIRVASMQDFRRSMNSLNTVPESQPRNRLPPGSGGGVMAMGQNQTFAAMSSSRPTRPMSSNNPLLKMMEERMAAKSKVSGSSSGPGTALPPIAASPSPEPPVMSDENKAALQASISKWGGLGTVASTGQQQLQGQQRQLPAYKPVSNRSGAMGSGSPPMGSRQQNSSSPELSPSGRVPLSGTQLELLKELTSSQQAQPSGNGNGMADSQGITSHTQEQLLQNLLQSGQASYNPLSRGMQTNRPTLTRCAFSSAEVDRLRRENQYIQLRRQMAIQEQRALEERILNEQSTQQALFMCQQQQQQQQPTPMTQIKTGNNLTQEMLNNLQVNTLNQIQRRSSNQLNTQPTSTSSRTGGSYRKRRSSVQPDDDESIECSVTSATNSMSSSASSHKIHRSLSHCSARATLSMENLRIKSSTNFLMNSASRNTMSTKNQSFSSGLNTMQGVQASMMRNQSFSSNNSNTSSRGARSRSSATRQQRGSPSPHTLTRSSSSTNWIKSLLSEQSSAGMAAATFEHALQQQQTTSSNSSPVTSTVKEQQEDTAVKATSSAKPVFSSKPIQVHAEEYPAVPIERPPSTLTAETVIISAVPDSIKYQNAPKPDKAPLDIVKDALAARGLKSDTKPTMNVDEKFFVKVTDMYDKEIVNTIRSNDVDALRKLFKNGTQVQCGNRFGETLIHLACRRSHREMVLFLVEEAGVSLHVRDDYGRTPMHDACWRAEPDLELLDFLLDRVPELLMLSDKRGHTPLDYARREHWALLFPFLEERTSKFMPAP